MIVRASTSRTNARNRKKIITALVPRDTLIRKVAALARTLTSAGTNTIVPTAVSTPTALTAASVLPDGDCGRTPGPAGSCRTSLAPRITVVRTRVNRTMAASAAVVQKDMSYGTTGKIAGTWTSASKGLTRAVTFA